MSILATEHVSHQFDDRPILSGQTFHLEKGDRIAVVGINGSGKSTLLKILAGKLQPQKGKVVSEKDIRIGYLEQDPQFQHNLTLEEFIYSGDNEKQRAVRDYESVLANDSDNADLIGKLADQLTELNAWEYEHEIKSILGRLALTDLSQTIGTLSGGQLKRLALAKLLIDELDIFILDEPTNHLDIETIEWLESYLCSGNKTILFVTHDRYFLDNVSTKIAELDQGSISIYDGKYSYFLEKKAEKLASLDAAFEKNSNLLRKELEWMRRQPKARTTKSKSRIDAFHDLEAKTQAYQKASELELSIKMSRQGGKILEINKIHKSFGDKKIISDFSYIFKKGDRIGLAGKNGSGKSTFLELLTNNIAPDDGTLNTGETTVIGYYHQKGLEFRDSDRVIDVVKDVAEYITMADGKVLTASQLLSHFLFPPARQHIPVSKLSGGERKRLQLMRTLIKNPNFLILDEPANDLDIDTLNVLEEFLVTYQGVLLLVSHDRYLLDKLTDQLFIFEGSGVVRIFNGNYTEYKLETEIIQKPRADFIKPNKAETVPPKKRSFKESKELESTESQIETLEKQIKALTDNLAEANTDTEKILKMVAEIDKSKKELDRLTERWLYLSELG